MIFCCPLIISLRDIFYILENKEVELVARWLLNLHQRMNEGKTSVAWQLMYWKSRKTSSGLSVIELILF